jgi:uncharacterized repeat protein (TIGR04138 family)
MTPPEDDFWGAIERIRDRDPRFRREAYPFLVAALGATVMALPPERRADPERRHLTGQELVAGTIRFARDEFGPLAATVFEEWGVRTSGDLGDMVFHLIAEQQLHARPEDRREDFDEGPDLLAGLRGEPAGRPRPEGAA